jgi:RNA polymerase sigma-70 factor (ECF subfamily)
MADLYRSYWYPLYAFARRRGLGLHDAEDLTQSFFAYLVEKNLFAAADRQIGKLRTFLLATFDRFLGAARDRENAQKRGGPKLLEPNGAIPGEDRYAHEPADEMTPEKLFERTWAYATLESALDRLAQMESDEGRATQFSELQGFLSAAVVGEASYGQSADRMRVSEATVRQAVSRLRKKFRGVLRQQIADTLCEPSEAQIEEELASLRRALRS